MRIQIKLSVLNEQGLPFLGRGPIQLLQGIKRLGSINAAAKEMNMSYVKAWKIIKRMEASLGGKVLKTEIGGKNHGGSELTPLADKFIGLYTAYEATVSGFAEEQFKLVKMHVETGEKGNNG